MEEKLPADRIAKIHSTTINSTHKTQPNPKDIFLLSPQQMFCFKYIKL